MLVHGMGRNLRPPALNKNKSLDQNTTPSLRSRGEKIKLNGTQKSALGTKTHEDENKAQGMKIKFQKSQLWHTSDVISWSDP